MGHGLSMRTSGLMILALQIHIPNKGDGENLICQKFIQYFSTIKKCTISSGYSSNRQPVLFIYDKL